MTVPGISDSFEPALTNSERCTPSHHMNIPLSHLNESQVLDPNDKPYLSPADTLRILESNNADPQEYADPICDSTEPQSRHVTSDLLREYPKKCNKSLTDEERWTEIGKAFDEYDEKMIESVKSSIDSLLVFAGLFSAVLTAFNILAYALLQDDPTDETPIILAQISQQLANLTNNGGHIASVVPPYVPSRRFHATTLNIVINILWFASLVLSLVSASIAILVKQWFQEYTDMTSSQMKAHMCIRQYRFQSLDLWKVNTIRKLLPLLLQLSLLLFFIGLLVLLWSVSIPVAAFVTVPVIIWLLFWVTTTVLPSVYESCPYRSAESSIVFTLVQQTMPSLRQVLRWLRQQVNFSARPRTLHLSWRRRTESRCYVSWRDRENDIVLENMNGLTYQMVKCADEILMDDRIHSHSVYLYVQAADNTDLLMTLFEKTAGDSEVGLSAWVPDASRQTRSLIRATMDVLKNNHTPSQDGQLEQHDQAPVARSQSVWLPLYKRQLLMNILGKFLRWNDKSIAQDIIRDLIDLPIYVDFRGLSILSLRDYMRGIRRARRRGSDVQLFVINAMAEYAVHEYRSDRWNSDRDAYNFAWLCGECIDLITLTERDKITSDTSNSLNHFKQLLQSLSELLPHFQTYQSGTSSGPAAACLCMNVHDLVATHPSLKPDLLECVKALSTISTHLSSEPNLYWSARGLTYRSARKVMDGLCAMYDI